GLQLPAAGRVRDHPLRSAQRPGRPGRNAMIRASKITGAVHYADLRALWHHLAGDDPPEQRLARTLDAWFHYVQTHPYAWGMLCRDSTGGGAAEDLRRPVATESRAQVLPLFARERGTADDVDLAWEAWRAAIQGLALWWSEHPDVSREHLVATTMNTL